MMSLRDILCLSKDDIEKKIFYIKYPCKDGQKTLCKYVQIKLTKFERDKKVKQIIQLINISSSILYNQ